MIKILNVLSTRSLSLEVFITPQFKGKGVRGRGQNFSGQNDATHDENNLLTTPHIVIL